jgi:perosamine synthetase
MKINFFSTTISKKIFKKINIILKKGNISSGKQNELFENSFSNNFKLKNCTAVNSGTSALHLALCCAGVKTGDEVILPAQTFLATAMVVLYQNAKVVFADIQKDTGNICPISIQQKITRKTKAIIVVHWAGYPCDMLEIRKIAKEKKILLIEDAAHALGAYYKNKPVGSISDFTCFSFQAIKHLTTGDGGMLVCKKNQHYRLAQKLKWFGIDRNSKSFFLGERNFQLYHPGFKYHMNDIAATLGLENIKIVKYKIKYLNMLEDYYRKNLTNISGVTLLKKDKDRKSSSWLFTILVKKRDSFFKMMNRNGIPVSVVHRRIDRFKLFGGVNKNLTNQSYFDKHQISLPLNDQLNKKNLDYIINVIKKNTQIFV